MNEDLRLFFRALFTAALRVLIYFISIPIMILLLGFIGWICGAI